jgi:hypothetical protein
MTEAEWRACSTVDRMLEYVPYTVSKRKWTLLAAAFCRRIWPLLTHERSRQAVDTAERWADGLVGSRELNRAGKAAAPYVIQPGAETLAASAAHMTALRGKDNARIAASCAAGATEAAGGSADVERKHQCAIIRDILGYPYRTITIDHSSLSLTVTSLAEAIYTDRAFDRLPILADALEDAGCTNADILEHCRGPGPHVRGCWVVDLLLAKE